MFCFGTRRALARRDDASARNLGNAPLLLAITPCCTGVVGIVFTRSLPYGYLSGPAYGGRRDRGRPCLTLASRARDLRGPASLVLGVKSWSYPPAIALGTVLLATLCVPWKKYCATRMVAAAPAESDKARENLHDDLLDDLIEMPPSGYGWLVVLMAFVAFAMFFVKLTGLRFVLFPAAGGNRIQMLGHTAICPWADKPMRLPLACFLTALGGFISWHFLGSTPLAAACSMAWGIAVLRMFDLHVPPALAVALLPLVMDKPTIAYPFAVGIGTTLLSLWFLADQRLSRGALSIPWAVRAAARR